MIFRFDDFELDAERLELRRGETLVKVDALVLRFLAALVQNAGRLVTKEELVESVWEGRAVADNVLTVAMARLRKTLGQRRGDREFVVTVYGRGYRFARDVVARSAPSWSPPSVLPSSAPELPFVGREGVLDRLRHALSEARAGRGRLCVLMGEPGIGKTRAVEALEHELAESEVRIAWGYCREAGDTPPLAPWLRLVREVTAVADRSALARGLGAFASVLDEMLRVPAPGAPSGEGAADNAGFPGSDRHRVFETMLRTFARAAEQTPWVLVLDDLHRADAASLELLSSLLDEIAHTRILVVATLRHARGVRAPRSETQLPYVLGHRNCERVAMGRLAPEDVAAYVAAAIDDPGGKLGRAVFEKSEGNPFYMVELARQLRHAADAGSGALAVPDRALELIRQNLERLDADVREVLAAAAVIGRSFELSLLATATGEAPSALMAKLDQAIAEEILIAAKDSMTAFAFSHELVRAVLYGALAPSERRRWHVAIAQALEKRFEAGEAVAPSELAYHCHAALPEGDLRLTVRFCRAAAAAAGAVFANSDVVRYIRQALEALELLENPSPRLRMQLLFNIALYARANATEFARAIGEVITLAREHGDGPTLVRAATMLNVHAGFQPLPGSAPAFEHALTLLQPDDAGMRSIALAGLACAAPHCYDAARSGELVTEAEALARKSGLPGSLQAALGYKLYMRGGPAHEREAAALADELERLAQQHPRLMPVVPINLSFRGAITALQRGDLGAVTTMIDAAAGRARELHHGELLWHCQRFRALSQINTGAWQEGKAALENLHRMAMQRSIIGTEPFSAFDRLVVFGEIGQPAVLDDAVRSAVEYEASDPPSLWALKLRALAAAGLLGEARAGLRALAPADVARLPCDRDYLGTLGHVAKVAVAVGALEYGEAVQALLAPYADRYAAHVSFLCEGAVPQLLGLLEHALGRPAAAAERFEVAIQMNDRTGLELRAAEARLQLAQCQLDAGQHARARATAQAGQELATRLGIQPLQSAAARLLAAR